VKTCKHVATTFDAPCRVPHPKTGERCTKAAGHDSPKNPDRDRDHAAIGVSGKVYASWRSALTIRPTAPCLSVPPPLEGQPDVDACPRIQAAGVGA
jgi:hypothetical protein